MKKLRFIGLCFTIAIIAALTIVMASCTSATTSVTLSSIAVSPISPSALAVGSTQTFTATATYSDNSTENVSSQVTWSSDTPAVATINSSGVASGIAAGTANITASLSGVTSAVAGLTVTAATVAVQVPPPTLSSIAI